MSFAWAKAWTVTYVTEHNAESSVGMLRQGVMDTDPDPAFHWNAEPEPGSINADQDLDPDPARRQSDTNLRPQVYKS